jgi:hypothetical protein
MQWREDVIHRRSVLLLISVERTPPGHGGSIPLHRKVALPPLKLKEIIINPFDRFELRAIAIRLKTTMIIVKGMVNQGAPSTFITVE